MGLISPPWFCPLRQRHVSAQWAPGFLLPGAAPACGCCSGLCQEGQAEERLQEVDVPLPFVSSSSSLPLNGPWVFVYTRQGQSGEVYPSPRMSGEGPCIL